MRPILRRKPRRGVESAAYNLLVDLGVADPGSLEGGFQECSPIGTEIAVAEHSNGRSPVPLAAG
jgi:hypothetical protein